MNVDARLVGISVILMQIETISGRRIDVVDCHGSSALTMTEQQYLQIEREGLAVVWACEHLHIYFYSFIDIH